MNDVWVLVHSRHLILSTTRHFIPPPLPQLDHLVYNKEEVHTVEVTHRTPVGASDHIALAILKVVRGSFDFATGYNRAGGRTTSAYLTRFIVLETVG